MQDITLPGTKLAGEITGGVIATAPLVAAAPGAFGLANAGRIENAARAALTSGALSGADAAARGRTPEEQVQSAIIGGTVSALLTPLLARTTGRVMAPRATGPSTIDEAQAAATRLYQAADEAGVRVAPQALATASADIRRAAVAANFDETLHPISARVMAIQSERASAGQPLSMRDLENVRRTITNQSRATTNADEQRVLGVIREQYDDFLSKLGTRPGEVLAGNPAEAVAATREARTLWRRAAVAERIGEAVERGARHASGLATGIRSEFRTLANSDKFMRSLSAEERAEVQKLASIKNFRSLLTLVARMDPHRSMINSGIGVGGGFMAGGPAGAIAVPVAGRTASALSDKLMKSRAMSVQRGVLRGSVQKPQSQSGRTLGSAFGVELSRRAGGQ